MDGVIVSPLKIIDVSGGDVLHAIKSKDQGFCGFGEAYFSTIEHRVVKAWKKHNQMVLNLVVPVGEVRFVLFNDQVQFSAKNQFFEIILSQSNYNRLTVPAGIWLGFQGLSEEKSIVLNIASIQHNPDEVERKLIGDIKYKWRIS